MFSSRVTPFALVKRTGFPILKQNGLLNVTRNNDEESQSLQPVVRCLDATLAPYFKSAQLAVRQENLAFVVEQCSVKLVSNHTQRVDVLDVLRFGSPIKLETSQPHHVVVCEPGLSGFFILDIKKSFQQGKIVHKRVEATFSIIRVKCLNVLTMVDIKNARIEDKKNYLLTLRVIDSENLSVKHKFEYELHDFFKLDSMTIPAKSKPPVRNIGHVARRAVAVPVKPPTTKLDPTYLLELTKDHLLIPKFFHQRNLTFSLLDLKSDGSWSVVATLDITDDFAVQPNDKLDLASICKFQTKTPFSKGLLLMLHPDNFGLFTVVQVRPSSVSQLTSFQDSRRAHNKLQRDLCRFLPFEPARLSKEWKRLFDPESEEGKRQKNLLKGTPPAQPVYGGRINRVIAESGGVPTPKFSFQSAGEYRQVAQTLETDLVTGGFKIIATYNRGEAYYRKGTNKKSTEGLDILEINQSVISNVKIIFA